MDLLGSMNDSEWKDTQQLPLETLADFQMVAEDEEEKELLRQHDPTIPQMPIEDKDNPHKKTALELVLRFLLIVFILYSYVYIINAFALNM